MSVFGGDSWATEAQQRKRRVDDLAVEQLDGSSYKRLSSGKYACLLCPNSPILDSPLMLSVRFLLLPLFYLQVFFFFFLDDVIVLGVVSAIAKVHQVVKAKLGAGFCYVRE